MIITKKEIQTGMYLKISQCCDDMHSSIKDNDIRISQIGIVTTNHRISGALVLSFCPFCGSKIEVIEE